MHKPRSRIIRHKSQNQIACHRQRSNISSRRVGDIQRLVRVCATSSRKKVEVVLMHQLVGSLTQQGWCIETHTVEVDWVAQRDRCLDNDIHPLPRRVNIQR